LIFQAALTSLPDNIKLLVQPNDGSSNAKFAKNHAYNWLVEGSLLEKIDAIAKSFTSFAREMLAGKIFY